MPTAGPGRGHAGALFVDTCHPRTLRLYQLEVRHRGEEDRPDEESRGVRGSSDRIYERGDRTQGEARRAEHEKPGDGGVQASRFRAHAYRETRTRSTLPTSLPVAWVPCFVPLSMMFAKTNARWEHASSPDRHIP
jgi:hypothetical protein